MEKGENMCVFALVGPHDLPFLFLFAIFVSSLGVCCSLCPPPCSRQPRAAVSEGKRTREAGAVSPASLTVRRGLRYSAALPSLPQL